MRANSRDSNRDFRIKSSSVSATTSQQKTTVPKPMKTTFKGLTKPHQLASQNDEIRRMLGMTPSASEQDS